MEEQVGALWHRSITRVSERRYPDGRGAPGGRWPAPSGSASVPSGATAAWRSRRPMASTHGARRGLLARVAGVGDKVALAWRDERALLLPPVIDRFPERGAQSGPLSLARGPGLGSEARPATTGSTGNQHLAAGRPWPASRASRPRYRRLVAAHLARSARTRPACRPWRPRPSGLIRQALTAPGSVTRLPRGRQPPPARPPLAASGPAAAAGQRLVDARTATSRNAAPDDPSADLGRRRRQAERAELPRRRTRA